MKIIESSEEKYISVDKSGYLKDQYSLNDIKIEWKLPIEKFVFIIDKYFSDKIKSVYIRGSVAAGDSIKFVSDIDFFIITRDIFGSYEKEFIKREAININNEFNFITKFDIGFYTFDEILVIKERVLVKLTAICVYGIDIKYLITNLKPGRDIALTLNGLKEESDLTLLQIADGYYDKTNTKSMCIWIMKRIVRAGFELTSERSNTYTRDLYLCWKNLSIYYPEQSKLFYRALCLAIYPTLDLQEIKIIIDQCIPWLLSEAVSFDII